MKVLFTGGSSFTGYWFVRELVHSGHDVTAILRRPPGSYEGVRGSRVAELTKLCECAAGISFGDPAFLDLMGRSPGWDVLCHHAADATDYKSDDFDVMAAVAANTANLQSLLQAMLEKHCGKIVLTGSVFENAEGAGSEGLPAFSPYGLSKAFTWEIFRYHARRTGLRLGKFVIPNPFGPFEEARFTAYLIRTWISGGEATVNTPAYVRDNIHVSLLAKAYARFVEGLGEGAGVETLAPSGYVESQGVFARRIAAEMRPRLNLECAVALKEQTEFSEPRIRINVDVPNASELGFSESRAWDELAAYYGGK
jgi:nucleoside-diphosphate-sugar epimerase